MRFFPVRGGKLERLSKPSNTFFMSNTLKAISSIEANKPEKSQAVKPLESTEPAISQYELNQFRGTSNHYRHLLNQFVYTDGVKYLAEHGQAYWLLDAIASHQPTLLKDPKLQGFQSWTLTVNLNNKIAKLVCERDTKDVVLSQDIPYTDFPLAEVKLYLIKKVLLLPSEY